MNPQQDPLFHLQCCVMFCTCLSIEWWVRGTIWLWFSPYWAMRCGLESLLWLFTLSFRWYMKLAVLVCLSWSTISHTYMYGVGLNMLHIMDSRSLSPSLTHNFIALSFIHHKWEEPTIACEPSIISYYTLFYLALLQMCHRESPFLHSFLIICQCKCIA